MNRIMLIAAAALVWLVALQSPASAQALEGAEVPASTLLNVTQLAWPAWPSRST